jgi:hypothetical protein
LEVRFLATFSFIVNNNKNNKKTHAPVRFCLLQKTATECGVTAMPTFLFYKNGARIAEVIGASQEKLKDTLDANL